MTNRILELLEKKGRISMAKDIFPVVMKEFENVPLNDLTYESAGDFVRQMMYAIHLAGIPVVFYPVFGGIPEKGALTVVDVIAEVIPTPKIDFSVVENDKQ